MPGTDVNAGDTAMNKRNSMPPPTPENFLSSNPCMGVKGGMERTSQNPTYQPEQGTFLSTVSSRRGDSEYALVC